MVKVAVIQFPGSNCDLDALEILQNPIAHNEGRYYLDKDQLAELERNEQIVLRYVDENDIPTDDSNPNGSLDNIAGICDKNGNVMGLMPHPERASLPILSPNNHPEGRVIFDSMAETLEPSLGGK